MRFLFWTIFCKYGIFHHWRRAASGEHGRYPGWTPREWSEWRCSKCGEIVRRWHFDN